MNTDISKQINRITIQDTNVKRDTQSTHQIIVLLIKNTTSINSQSTNPSQQLISQIYQIIQSDSSLEKCISQKSSIKLENNPSFKCKCKKTKCLKMYCECFAQGKYCKDCLCSDCRNLVQFEKQRAAAIDQALQRDPDVFDPKAKKKKGGCICKKTNCLKKYCECFNSGILCTQQCKCLNCLNCNNKSVDEQL